MICTRQLDSIPLWNASTNICLWNQSYEIGRCQVFSCQNGTSTKCLEERFKEFSAKKAPRVKKPWNQFKRENVINQDYLCVWTDLQILILGCSPNPREISCRHFVLSVCVSMCLPRVYLWGMCVCVCVCVFLHFYLCLCVYNIDSICVWLSLASAPRDHFLLCSRFCSKRPLPAPGSTLLTFSHHAGHHTRYLSILLRHCTI